MYYMFSSASSFNQDIGGWNVSKVGNFYNMFYGVTLSVLNYDSLLIGWSNLILSPFEVFSAGSSKYSPGVAATARQKIVDTYNWLIYDAGEASPVNVTFVNPTPLPESTLKIIPINISSSSIQGISSITIYIYNSTGIVQKNTTFSNLFFWNISNLLEGTYYLNATSNSTEGVVNSTETRNYTIDATFPLIDLISPIPTNNSYVLNSMTINLSIFEENLNEIIWNWNGVETSFNTSHENLINLGSGNYTFSYVQTGIAAGESYLYNFTVIDSVNNKNTTKTRIINGDAAPSFVTNVYSPSISDNLDPNENTTIAINVSDIGNNLDIVIFQWKNNSLSSEWVNITMSNTTVKSAYTALNTIFTLPSYETNITYRIWANDTLGAINKSTNKTFESAWDCSWTSTSTLGSTAGYDQNKNIGKIIINNTGDIEYTNNNCSLDFRVTYDITEGRIFYDELYIKNLHSASVAAGSSQDIQINATFGFETKEENVIIALDEYYSRSSMNLRNTSATIVTNKNGPYLVQSISSSPTTVYLTPGNFSLDGYVRNLMGSAIPNVTNTAYNVTFNWSLADGLEKLSGSTNISFVNISNSSQLLNNLVVGFSDLESMTTGVKTIDLYLRGYNSTGGLISNADGNTLLTESVNISFLCYGVSDGIIVADCGSIDGDYEAPVIEVPSDNSGAAGGGGGGGASVNLDYKYSSEEIIELVIGTEQRFPMKIKNTYKSPKKNIKISILKSDGAEVIIDPSEISYLDANSETTVDVILLSEAYQNEGSYELFFKITGEVVTDTASRSFVETKRLKLYLLEISRNDADLLINNSIEALSQMKELNLSTKEVENYLDSLGKSYSDLDFGEVEVATSTIKQIYSNAKESKEILNSLGGSISNSEYMGIDVINSKKIYLAAKMAFLRGDYSTALEKLKEAQLTYALEVKGKFNLIQYVKNKPLKSLGILAGILFLILIASLVSKYFIYKNKIKRFANEEKLLLELMKVVQKECFEKAKMSMKQYYESMIQYEKKLSKTIQKRIEIEAKFSHLMKFKGKKGSLNFERNRIIELIKKLQNDYMVKGNIETKIYESMLKSYSARLSEIEETTVFLEAKKALKGKNIIKAIFKRKIK